MCQKRSWALAESLNICQRVLLCAVTFVPLCGRYVRRATYSKTNTEWETCQRLCRLCGWTLNPRVETTCVVVSPLKPSVTEVVRLWLFFQRWSQSHSNPAGSSTSLWFSDSSTTTNCYLSLRSWRWSCSHLMTGHGPESYITVHFKLLCPPCSGEGQWKCPLDAPTVDKTW